MLGFQRSARSSAVNDRLVWLLWYQPRLPKEARRKKARRRPNAESCGGRDLSSHHLLILKKTPPEKGLLGKQAVMCGHCQGFRDHRRGKDSNTHVQMTRAENVKVTQRWQKKVECKHLPVDHDGVSSFDGFLSEEQIHNVPSEPICSL